MDLSNQEIRFNILISNIQQILSQTNEIAENVTKLLQPKVSGKTVMKQMGEDTDSAIMKLKTYEQQLSALRQAGARSFMSGDTTGFAKYKKEFDDLNTKMVEFNKQWGVHNRGFYSLSQSADYFFAKLRYRLAA